MARVHFQLDEHIRNTRFRKPAANAERFLQDTDRGLPLSLGSGAIHLGVVEEEHERQQGIDSIHLPEEVKVGQSVGILIKPQ